MNYQMLVNKENVLDKNYVPENLIEYTEYNGEKIDSTHKTLVEETTLEAFMEMKNEALKYGFEIIIDSAYRSYDYQQRILDNYLEKLGIVAYDRVALPGTSEHQTGLAIDVALVRDGQYCDDFDDSADEIKWLADNSYKFGFILRYPKGKEDITWYNYECWHFRYVGRELSVYMKENDIETLEEYYSKDNKKRIK